MPTNAKSVAAWRKRNPEKARAQSRVNYLVRIGKLIRPEVCPKCNVAGRKVDGHHADYSKPEEVDWCCAKCHKADNHRGKWKRIDGTSAQYEQVKARCDKDPTYRERSNRYRALHRQAQRYLKGLPLRPSQFTQAEIVFFASELRARRARTAPPLATEAAHG